MLKTTVDFLRHGEVSGGTYYRGSTDDPLTKLGWQQMQCAVNGQSWDQIITSPLHRCLDFAQHMHTQTNIPFSTTPKWQEINFGSWEGKTAEQINSTALKQYYRDPMHNTPENAESYSVFMTRIEQAWKRLITDHLGKHLLVITHAGVIRNLFILLLNLPIDKVFSIQVDHASLTRFQIIHDNPDDFIQLVFHNFRLLDLTVVI